MPCPFAALDDVETVAVADGDVSVDGNPVICNLGYAKTLADFDTRVEKLFARLDESRDRMVEDEFRQGLWRTWLASLKR